MSSHKQITIGAEMAGERLDKCIAALCPEFSRSHIQKMIKEGGVCVNGIAVKANYRPAAGEQAALAIPDSAPPDILPQDIPLDILYEDEDVIVVNKPKGMVVHPAAGHTDGTLVNALLYHCGDSLSGINGVLRPGIVHRIDRDTTGVLVACKNDRAHACLAAQLKEHSITRRYRALLFGILRQDEGCIDAPVGRHPVERKKMAAGVKNGKRAVTHYRVLRRYQDYTYVECRLETGRTHQIRVHMASIGHPLAGDSVYTGRKAFYPIQGQVLHAMTLGFRHPSTGAYMEFEAPLPEYFRHLLDMLENCTN